MSLMVPVEGMERNTDRYLLLAENGQIILITRGETVVAKLIGVRAEEERADKLRVVKSIFGILPKNASLEAPLSRV